MNLKRQNIKSLKNKKERREINSSYVKLSHPSPFISFQLLMKCTTGTLSARKRRAFNMAESSTTSASGEEPKKKRLPEEVLELIDVAIFTFGCQTGLRATHKVRGDPVLEGAAAFFGQLLVTAKPSTMDAFNRVSPSRLGGWRPGDMPTKELQTFLSSRIKRLKNKQAIREDMHPDIPDRLLEKDEWFDEEADRVVTRLYPRCWRCQERCEFCRGKWKNYPKFGDFRCE